MKWTKHHAKAQLKELLTRWGRLRCPSCRAPIDLDSCKHRTTDSLDVGVGPGMPLEQEVVCECGKVVGYWAYGFYEPPTSRWELWHMRFEEFKYRLKLAKS